jgi:hypothetical protein
MATQANEANTAIAETPAKAVLLRAPEAGVFGISFDTTRYPKKRSGF